MWDQRYSTQDFVYGVEPNDFLARHAHELPAGRILSLAEGEGRNGVWLAARGYQVTGVDSSAVGLAKARKLAHAQGVEIVTVHADLADFAIETAAWDGIVAIFCHLPPVLRRRVFNDCVSGLRPGGVMLLEAYTPEQLRHGTGGPPSAELMLSADILRAELAGLEFLLLQECERAVHEGAGHTGTGAVVQMVARKPA